MKEALSQLQSSLEKVQRQEKGLKKVSSDSSKKRGLAFPILFFYLFAS